MSAEAQNLLTRMRTVAKNMTLLQQQVNECVTAGVNLGVNTEVTALATPTTLVPGGTGNTDCTKAEFQNFMSTLEEFNNFYDNAAVATQNNRSYTQNVLNGV